MRALGGEALIDRLTAIVGPEHVTWAPALDVEGLRPAVAVSPGTSEEAARVLAAARAAGAAVTPWGGGTAQRIGAPPARLDIVLRTERLDAALEWEPADLTACLGAGMTLAAAQRTFAAREQEIPIDAPCAERATLGGLAATAVVGPRRWRHGGWRDLIIGMHMALADGAVIKSGGRVVKNVQGYDLAKLFTGSLGTLGVIVQVNVKLLPLPPARRLFVAWGGLGAVVAFLEAVAGSQARVSAIDLLDEAAATACGLDGRGWAGAVLVEGPPTTLDGQSRTVDTLARDAGASCEAVDGDALEPIWRAWVDLGRADDLTGDEALLSVSALPAEAGEVALALTRAAERHGCRARVWARAGNGLVYARLTAPAGTALTVLPSVHAAILSRWRATTLTAGDPAVARAARPWGADPPGLAVMRAVKARFDPAGILQPGRFVGGI